MFEAAIDAIFIILDPVRFGFLTIGVVIGLAVGIVPGLGGLVGLSILLPFTYALDPYAAIAMLLALSSVVATGDTIPAVLFGVPGTVGSAATVVDGYPMAQKGEAGRAFGAAFSASLLGGLFGAMMLFVSIPVLRPLVLIIGPPELFALCLFGISLVALLSGSNRLKGLAAACLGLLMSAIGDDPNTATPRWTFNTLYLFDGVPLVPLALGMFALPELAGLMMRGGTISRKGSSAAIAGQWQGIRDTFANLGLVFRSSVLGAGLGAIPGLGASIIDWIAYGVAAKTEKGADKTFGHGDVRGVIASESSNNAKEGGSLIPTIAFGVPGTASMAILLGAFQIHGIVPGQTMLTEKLDLTYAMVWSIALANVLGAGICFLFANQLARLALVRVGILVPVVLAVTLLGAFQNSASIQDVYAVIAFGLLGMIMKIFGWSRPALVLGFVLGSLIERYLVISYSLAGVGFLLRPIVAIIVGMTILGIVIPVFKTMIARWRRPKQQNRRGFALVINEDLIFAALIVVVFLSAFFTQQDWPLKARLMPNVFAGAGIVFAIWVVFGVALTSNNKREETRSDGVAAKFLIFGFSGLRETYLTPSALRGLRFFVYCLGFVILVQITGVLISVFLLTLVLLSWESREKLWMALCIAGGVFLFSYGLFHLLVNIPWPNSMLGDVFPALRDSFMTDIL
tara:strand:+ start:994 stop:3042 length:2049 start_codon:yes stop_codon:yes gene_type:complete